MRVGGRDTDQLIVQQRLALRDDVTRFVKWHGSHALKGGAVLSLNDYRVNKGFSANPVFRFRSAESWAFPFEARLRRRRSRTSTPTTCSSASSRRTTGR